MKLGKLDPCVSLKQICLFILSIHFTYLEILFLFPEIQVIANKYFYNETYSKKLICTLKLVLNSITVKN